MDTLVEDLEVILASDCHVGHITTHGSHQAIEVVERGLAHLGSVVDKLVTEGRELGVIRHAVHTQPPLAQQRSNERGNQSAHVDEDVENLETAVAFALGELQRLGTLLGSLGLEIVVELTYDSLQVALEQTVTERYEKQSKTSERKQPGYIAAGSQNRN